MLTLSTRTQYATLLDAETLRAADHRPAIELVVRHALALDPAAVGKTIAVLSSEPLLTAKLFGFLAR